jgi:hypothetical protein
MLYKTYLHITECYCTGFTYCIGDTIGSTVVAFEVIFGVVDVAYCVVHEIDRSGLLCNKLPCLTF